MVEYYSHGKLLLTAEYAVLDGAKCLAVPTKLGQSLRVSPLKKSLIDWKSFDHQGNLWFEKEITIETGIKRNFVGNIAAGLEWLFHDKMSMSLGAFTNFSSADPIEESKDGTLTQDALPYVNEFGATAVLGYFMFWGRVSDVSPGNVGITGVSAHAGLGKVVRAPLPDSWPILAAWRLDPDGDTLWQR